MDKCGAIDMSREDSDIRAGTWHPSTKAARLNLPKLMSQ